VRAARGASLLHIAPPGGVAFRTRAGPKFRGTKDAIAARATRAKDARAALTLVENVG